MNCGAAFIFDADTEAAVRAAWQGIADAGVSPFMLGLDYPPHISIFMAEAIDIDGLRQAWAALAATLPPFPLTFPSLGIFGGAAGVVYLTPTTTRSLLDLHRRFWDAAQPYLLSPAAYYGPGEWAPHITLGFQLSQGQVGQAVHVLKGAPSLLPKAGNISGVLFGSFQFQGGSILERIHFSGSNEK